MEVVFTLESLEASKSHRGHLVQAPCFIEDKPLRQTCKVVLSMICLSDSSHLIN